VLDKQIIVVRGGKVEAMGGDLKIPAGAKSSISPTGPCCPV
jgi:hypothetical protein